MDWTDDQEQLVDRFLNDTMTGEDLKEWEVLMKIPTFRWHVEKRKKDFERGDHKDDSRPRFSFDRKKKPSRGVRVLILIIILILMLLVVFST